MCTGMLVQRFFGIRVVEFRFECFCVWEFMLNVGFVVDFN